MDLSKSTNPLGKEFHVTSASNSHLNPNVDVSIKVVPSKNPDNIPTIIIDPSSNNNDLTVTPAFPNFPTDEEVVIEPESIIIFEPSDDTVEQNITSELSSTPTPRPSSQKSQLLDELKYLLKPTNSLATGEATVQASQEADASIKRRTMTFDEDMPNDSERSLIEGLSPKEARSLSAADRRSVSSRSQRLSSNSQLSQKPHSQSVQPIMKSRSNSRIQSPTILIAQHEPRNFLDRLPGLIWSFIAIYSFSIILFLTKRCGIDLIFGFFLQTIIQTIAFGVYAIYKGYNLLGPPENRFAMICRAVLGGIGAQTAFLAYYYITLSEVSAIRQTQVVLTIILSVFILHERITISRIIACILTIIAIVVLLRPIKFGQSSSFIMSNVNDTKNFWVPYSSSLNHIIGISFALCTAITYCITTIMTKNYVNTHHLHNTVLCFWSALSALIISIVLVSITHFGLKDARSFPHDWRLFVGIALALASIFVFIANQKAIKREHRAIVTLIYSTDIILALFLQNVFTIYKSDLIVISGCILILVSILIVCIEVLVMDKRKNTLAIEVAKVASTTAQDANLPPPPIIKTKQKRLSI